MFSRITTISAILAFSAALALAPEAQANIKTAKGCKTRVLKRNKRKACLACIARPRPHAFFKKAPAGRRCKAFKMARAKMAPVNAPTAIKTAIGCKARVVKPSKRQACKACVKRPRAHAYFKGAKPGNRCKRLMSAAKVAPVAAGGIRFAKGCRGKVVKPGKRQACLACVSRPRQHAFFKRARKGSRCKRLVR
jgi:hypothetical protein